MMSRWGIRSKLLLMALMPPLLIALFLGLYLVQTRISGHENSLEARGQAIARQIALASEYAIHTRQDELLKDLVNVVSKEEDVVSVVIQDAHGQILASSLPRHTPTTLQQSMMTAILGWFVSEDLQLKSREPVKRTQISTGRTTHILSANPSQDVLGWVTVELSMNSTTQRQSHALFESALITFAMVVVSAMIGLWTSRTVTTPVLKLTEAIQELEKGHLETRVNEDFGGEIGTLQHGFNTMATALQQAHDELQDKVEQATQELRETLEAVEIQNVELDLARKKALEASKVKSEFLANMSHEIRTPINGILGFTDLLTHTQLNDEQKDYVNTIKESGANLLAIINDILDFSKIEAGKLVIDSVAFDLRDCVEEVLSLLAPAAYGKNLELVHLIYSDVPVKLYGDPIRIRQVLTNLAHNAIKFTPAGRVIVRVMLDEDNEKDVLLRITVADTGIGLCEADQKKLFNAFSQADTSTTRRFGGAGLGLVISKKLVEQMGGTVGLESEPEKGSTFWFTLRLIKQKVSDSDKKITPLHGRRLLLFDEQPLSRLALRHLFEAWEIAVSDVDNRQSFVSMLSAPDSWDMAVMGISRSDLASSSLNQTMQRIRRFEVPLIALANTVDRNELRSLFQYGAQVALPKSTRRQTLYREICRLLDSPKEASQFYPEETSTPVAVKSVHHGREDDKQIRIMVVDDNRINRKLATTLSIKQGASVVEAENGQEAVSHAMKGQFDVILMDIHMPLMNGEEAAVKMREIYDGKQQPIIIALTANAMPGEKERLLASGMDECLIKPITEDQLSTILKKFVADSKKEEENMVLNQHPVSVSDPAPLLASSKPETASVGKKSLTDELLSMLIAELPVHQKQIHEHWEAGNMQALQDSVHKLNGAASVCNVPPLKEAADELESYLRNRNMKKIPESYELLMAEIEALHVQKTDG